MAYRFITKKKSEIEVRDEEISLKFPTEFGAVWSPSKSFKTAYEIPYKKVTTTEIIEMEKKYVAGIA